MCFNKSSSSSPQTTASTTTQRDERIAATEGSNVLSVKDGGYGSLGIANYNLAPEIVRDALQFNSASVKNSLDFGADAINRALSAVTETNNDAFQFSDDVTDRALNALIEGGEDALSFAGDVFSSAIGAVNDGSDRANAFVTSTQSQFAEARETDTKQLLEQLVKMMAIGAAGLVAYQVMR